MKNLKINIKWIKFITLLLLFPVTKDVNLRGYCQNLKIIHIRMSQNSNHFYNWIMGKVNFQCMQ